MDFRQLRYFVAVCEDLSFRHAAARLEIAQPPLSLAIKRLENELSVQLLERNTRSVRVTRAGAAFLAEAKRVLAQVNHAAAVVRSIGKGQGGHLRVAYINSASYALLPALIPAFRARYPEVDLELQESTSIEIVKQLAASQIDVGLLTRQP